MTQICLDFCNNHMGDRSVLAKMLEIAADNNVDYVKFQLYNPSRLNENYPNYANYFDYLCKHALHENDIEYIFKTCDDLYLKPMFTIFSKDMLKYLPSTSNFELKIGSAEAHKKDLIEECIKLDTPVWVSTGMLTDKEFEEHKSILGGMVHYMYCISRYPTPYSMIDFNALKPGGYYKGFSDHTLGIEATKEAVKLKVELIEKHFTLSKYLPGKDHSMSITPDELKALMNWKTMHEFVDKYRGRWVE
jgi:sialic acid synthase SpsE